jgi:amino acid adenylation domain-containing protein
MSVIPATIAGSSDAQAWLADVEESLPSRFERVARLYPSRIALGSGTWQATYRELNAAANGLANTIVSAGLKRGERVAVLMRHDTPRIAAILAAVKAAGVVVVLNATDPPARLQSILDDAEPRLLVADEPNGMTAAELSLPFGRIIHFDKHLSNAEDGPNVPIAADDIALLIYTSGSTGRPKGVMQTHRNVLHNVRRLSRGMQFSATDRMVLLGSPSGGQGMANVWCALLNGAALCPFAIMEIGVARLGEWMRECRISVFTSSASVFRNFTKTLGPNDVFPEMRVVRVGSEPATSDDFAAFQRHFRRDCVFCHTLSCTETGNVTQLHLTAASHVPNGRLSAGSVVDGVEMVFMDESGREVADGEIGEMVVRSNFLSPGYWRNETLTKERFSPAAGNGTVRAFRSGNFGRRLGDGSIVFVGRKDTQVKIHGFRVEISEIEDALARQPGVAQAVVCADGEAGLIGFVVEKTESKCSPESLRLGLRAVLPQYMIPTGFVFLPEFPLTPHGKIDRQKLLEFKAAPSIPTLDQMPKTETEILLAGIWGKVFSRESVGRDENFFNLGGDSLNAAVVAARVYAAVGVELDLRAFADHPSLSDLASAVDARCGANPAENAPKLARAPRDKPLPLSFAQERIWRFSQTVESSRGYTVAQYHLIRGPLDTGLLRQCMNALAQRHEILRTTFEESDATPVQIIHSAQPISLPILEASEIKALRRLRDEARRPFDLRRGPLIRFSLLRIGPREHWLLRVNQHIISDAWSWKIYFRQLKELYEQRLAGRALPEPNRDELQYADYAAWQRSALHPQDAAYQAAVQWWAERFSPAATPVRLPFARPKPLRRAAAEDGLVWWGLDPQLSQRLDQVARHRGATYYVIRLAAFAAILAEQTKSADLILGAYVTNRLRIETQNMFGPFANLMTLRFRYENAQPFSQWLESARDLVGQAQARGEIPYEQLREELSKRNVPMPEIGAIFGVSEHTAAMRLGAAEMIWGRRSLGAMPWGFSLDFNQHNESDKCRAMFDARLYDPAGVRNLIARLTRFLDAVSRDPDRPIVQLLD